MDFLNFMDKETLEKELTISPEDWKNITPEQQRAVETNKHPLHSPVVFSSDYFFDCEICKTAAPHLNPYRILKSTDNRVKTEKGIFPMDFLRGAPENSSELNYIPGVGYICDHCNDTIWEQD